jgi:antitoxin component YwqK of YwqJK toxin-antitoxin module
MYKIIKKLSNMMEEFTRKMAQNINARKELVIRQKLKEIVGIEIDIVEEERRRFKRLLSEYRGNEQTIYFNDGSPEGKRIVTFVKNEIPFDAEKFTLRYEEAYY